MVEEWKFQNNNVKMRQIYVKKSRMMNIAFRIP